jgi:hypothetical protein
VSKPYGQDSPGIEREEASLQGEEDRLEVGLPVASGPKTTLKRNPINEQDFGRSLIASFWSSKSGFGLDFLDFEMTLRP